jgi:hypothetical protein
MVRSERNLIQKLKERNANREHATDGQLHPRKPIPPAATKDIQVAERALGFQVPALLRAIYSEVANGGFGPEYGIVGTKGGFKLDKCSLESCYQGPIMVAACGPVWIANTRSCR